MVSPLIVRLSAILAKRPTLAQRIARQVVTVQCVARFGEATTNLSRKKSLRRPILDVTK